VHLVWTTVKREPLITDEIEGAVYRCIGAKLVELRCKVIAIGGIENHVHVLLELHSTVSVAELVKQLKGGSSHLANTLAGPTRGFGWDDSYGAFTVGVRQLNKVKYYIDHQREHHRDGTVFAEFEQTTDEGD